MKQIIAMVALVVALAAPVATVSAATKAELAHAVAQLNLLKTMLEQVQFGTVLGATTDTDFRVISNGAVVAESYVPVSEALAYDWCADMEVNPVFGDTTIECVWEGQLIVAN